jgi:Tol biopolymer transport system component
MRVMPIRPASTVAASLPLCLILSGCGMERPASWADPLAEGIVHTTLRPPNMDIYLFDEPGGTPQRLTDHPALDYNAIFSPDGRWIVFTSERAGGPDLYALELDGGAEPVRLTQHEALDDAAAFSPDGARLAFVSTREGNADIFVMPFAPGDSTAERRAENLTRRPGGDFNPAFSPDGRLIAFSRQDTLFSTDPTRGLPNYGVDLYVMEADGSNPQRLSPPGPGADFEGFRVGRVSGSPAWSLDGRVIYYYRIDGDGGTIRRVAPDGSDDEFLAATGISPAVRPDGRVGFTQPQPRPGLDAFDVLRTGRIVSVAPDGSGLRAESDTVRSYFAPDFDRAGRMVAHGNGPVEGMPIIREGMAFAPPGAQRQVRLPDRTVEVRGIRGYFPALTTEGDVLSTPLHLAGSVPAVPLQISGPDGGEIRDLFTPDSGTFAWGAAVARDAGRVVVAVGPPFAPGEAPVDIWTLGLDGSDAVNLTAEVEANDALPHVSPDGRRIVFRSGGDGGGSVYVMNSEGGERRRLTDADAIETMPALSPDGEWVVFPTDMAGGRKLWIQRVDGSEGRFLEPDRLDIPDFSMHPRFSPDGRWVVFTSDRAAFNDEWPLTWFPQPYGDLWALPVAGGDAIRLTHNKWEDGPSDWGPVRLPEQK